MNTIVESVTLDGIDALELEVSGFIDILEKLKKTHAKIHKLFADRPNHDVRLSISWSSGPSSSIVKYIVYGEDFLCTRTIGDDETAEDYRLVLTIEDAAADIISVLEDTISHNSIMTYTKGVEINIK